MGSGGRRVSELSHWLVWVLRHHATGPKLRVDPGGWFPLADLLAHARHYRRDPFDLADVLALLRDHERKGQKRRLQLLVAMKGTRAHSFLALRAAQGHTLPELRPELIGRPLSCEVAALVGPINHRTFRRAAAKILLWGLVPGGP